MEWRLLPKKSAFLDNCLYLVLWRQMRKYQSTSTNIPPGTAPPLSIRKVPWCSCLLASASKNISSSGSSLAPQAPTFYRSPLLPSSHLVASSCLPASFLFLQLVRGIFSALLAFCRIRQVTGCPCDLQDSLSIPLGALSRRKTLLHTKMASHYT